jgi:hypothetical protein
VVRILADNSRCANLKTTQHCATGVALRIEQEIQQDEAD